MNFPSNYLYYSKIHNEGEVRAFAMFLYEIVLETKPLNVLEIGVCKKGISTHIILHAMDSIYSRDNTYNGKLYSLDVLNCSNVISDENPIKRHWNFIQTDSKQFKWDQKNQIDLLMIDGDHSYGGVKADYFNFEPCVKNGGYLLLHDVIFCPGVKRFWNEDIIKYPKVDFGWSNGFGIIHKVN